MTNDVLRRLRLGREWTQGEVAKRVNDRIRASAGRDSAIDANVISRLERGVITWPEREVRDALRAVFGVTTNAELGLFSKRTRRDREEVSESKRRDVLGISLAAILPDVLPTPSRVGMKDVEDVADRTFALEEWDRRSGGLSTRHLAFGELRSAVDLTRSSMGPRVRDRLCGQIANLADLAAWSAFDAGQNAPARSTFGLGIAAAREAGDDGLLCHVSTGLARQEIAERRPGDALALADIAMGNVPLSALAMIAAVKAQAYAVQGDEAEVMRQIALAESIYSRVTDLRSEPRWMWYFTEHKLHGETGHALYLLATVKGGPVSDVVSRLRRAVDSQTSNRARAKAIGTAQLATVLHRQGARDEAAHYGRIATGLSAVVHSARLDAALAEMRRAQA
jgi:transcriptional regulator with XRE-family HTH domain